MNLSKTIFGGTLPVRRFLACSLRKVRIDNDIDPYNLDDMLGFSADYPRCTEWEADNGLMTGQIFVRAQTKLFSSRRLLLWCPEFMRELRNYFIAHKDDFVVALDKWNDMRVEQDLRSVVPPGNINGVIIMPGEQVAFGLEECPIEDIHPMLGVTYYAGSVILKELDILQD